MSNQERENRFVTFNPEISSRLFEFEAEWLRGHPDHTKVISFSRGVLKNFMNDLGVQLVLPEQEEWEKHIVLFSRDKKSKGYYPSPMEFPIHSDGFFTTKKEDLEPLGLNDFGVFIEVDNQPKEQFGHVLFHESFHYMVQESANKTGFRFPEKYGVLEEGFVSYLARGAMCGLSYEFDDPDFSQIRPHEIRTYTYEVVFSAFLDRLAKAENSKGRKPWHRVYRKVIEKGIGPLFLGENIRYMNRLTNKAFGKDGSKKLLELLEGTTEEVFERGGTQKILELYNFIAQRDFESWEEQEKWWLKHKHLVLYSAIYWPPYLTMVRSPLTGRLLH